MKTYKLIYLLPLLFAVGCEPEFDEIAFNGGTADFSRTVAVGNSLTAGFQSNALSLKGQQNSIPEILAKQLKEVGGGDFKTPFLSGEAGEKGAGLDIIASTGLLVPALSLQPSADCKGTVSLAPKLSDSPYSLIGSGFLNLQPTDGPYNNIGVPGARVGQLNLVGYGSLQGNPYFARFAANPGQTMIQAAMAVNPTFFTLWIGNNDVLGYSTSGGEEGGDAITDVAIFESEFKRSVDSLTKNGAKGAVANIPSITTIPFFTTVPANALPLRQGQADSLNAAYAQYNGGLDLVVSQNPAFAPEATHRKIKFTAGANYFVTADPSLTDLSGNGLPSIRQLKPGELLTLRTPQDSIKCFGFGSVVPMPGKYALLKNEIDKINAAVNNYNNIIKQVAKDNNLAYVDANAKLMQVESGLKFNGSAFSTKFATGGAFSFDGVHPTSRGYVIVANTFIEAINAKYSAKIPLADVNAYPNQ